MIAVLMLSTGSSQVSLRAQEISIIDHLVLFSPEAAEGAGGADALQALVNQAVSEVNLAFDNSRIDARVRLVHLGPITEPEVGNTSADLSRLKSPDDGFYDIAHELRTQHGADLVTLIVEAPQSSGVGRGNQFSMFSTPSDQIAFSVILRRSLVGTFTLAHELGHNLGAHHTPSDQGAPGRFPYSNAWRFTAEGTTYRTIMARQFGEKIGFFSNPEVTFKGEPTGSPADSEDPADNAATINQIAPDVSHFRPATGNHDAFNQAAVLEGFWALGSGTNQDATGEANEPAHAGAPATHSIWWQWTSPVTDQIEVSTIGTTFSHRLGVYLGDTLESLSTITSGITEPTNEPIKLPFTVTAGQRVFIAIDSLQDATGFASIQLRKDNDTFVDSIHLSDPIITSNVLSHNATAEPREPNHGNANFPFFGASKSVWWTWTPPYEGMATITTQGTTYSSLLGVYQGDDVRNLTLIAEENFTGANGPWRKVTFDATMDMPYHIAIDAAGGLGNRDGMAILHVNLDRSESIRFTSIELMNADQIQLNIEGFTAQSFQLEGSSDLSIWEPIEQFTGDDLPVSHTIPMAHPEFRFFRAVTTNP